MEISRVQCVGFPENVPFLPGLEGLLDPGSIGQKQVPWEDLDCIAPGNRDRPREPSIVADGLLQNPFRVYSRSLEEKFQGVCSCLVGENRVDGLQVVDGQQGCHRMSC